MVLLAHTPDEVQRQVLQSLQRVTRYTVTQPRLLMQQVESVRRDGVATTNEEMTLGGMLGRGAGGAQPRARPGRARG
ncbi:MAG: IclR family transcriptional regulator [Aeromicrobium sp.]|nr:IclR family transcriptional regulator [Aeromicrobium sp.]